MTAKVKYLGTDTEKNQLSEEGIDRSGPFLPAGSHLEFTEDDDSRILIVSLLLFVLGIQTVPHHLQQRNTGFNTPQAGLKSACSSTDLISAGNFLHFPERCVELADEIVFPPGVIIPDEAL